MISRPSNRRRTSASHARTATTITPGSATGPLSLGSTIPFPLTICRPDCTPQDRLYRHGRGMRRVISWRNWSRILDGSYGYIQGATC